MLLYDRTADPCVCLYSKCHLTMTLFVLGKGSTCVHVCHFPDSLSLPLSCLSSSFSAYIIIISSSAPRCHPFIYKPSLLASVTVMQLIKYVEESVCKLVCFS